MKVLKLLTLAIILSSFSSCIMLLGPKKQAIQLQSSQGEVTVSKPATYNKSEEEVGKGQNVTYTLKKMEGTVQQVDISAEGYKTRHQVISPKGRMAIVWPVQLIYIPVLFFPTLMDLGTPTAFVYNKQIPIEPLMKLPTYTEGTKRVYFDGITLVEEGKTLEVREFTFKHKKGNDVFDEIKIAEAEGGDLEKTGLEFLLQSGQFESAEEQIYDYMREQGYMDTVNTVFKDNNNSVWLQASIESYNQYTINVKSPVNYYKGKATVKWYIRNTYDELVDSIVRTDFSDDFRTNFYSTILSDIVENSYINLLNSSEFQDKMKMNTDYSLGQAPLAITKPKTPVTSVKDAEQAAVVVKSKDGHGSGFAISNDGYVVTNYHVISGDKKGTPVEFWIERPDGGKTKATLVRFNEYRDLALLKVDTVFTKAFQLNNQKNYVNFKEVFTCGAPKYTELSKSYQKGVVSNDRTAFGMDYIQLSMAVNGGNSGGPLFDDKGVLCGVIVSKLVGYSTEGVGFAIPGHKISEYLKLTQ